MAITKVLNIPGVKLDQTDTTPQFQVGQIAHTAAGRYIYVQAAAACADNYVVAIASDYTILGINTARAKSGGRVGVLDGGYVGSSEYGHGSVASGSYAWAHIEGPSQANVLSACAAGVALYTSASDGFLDDAASASGTTYAKINGVIVGTSAPATAVPTLMQLGDPFVALP